VSLRNLVLSSLSTVLSLGETVGILAGLLVRTSGILTGLLVATSGGRSTAIASKCSTLTATFSPVGVAAVNKAGVPKLRVAGGKIFVVLACNPTAPPMHIVIK
jgi:hypothetical protein